MNLAEDRLKLTRGIAGAPDDTTTEKFLKLKGMEKLLDVIFNKATGLNPPSIFSLKDALLRRTFQQAINLGPACITDPVHVSYRVYYHKRVFDIAQPA